MKQQTQTTVRQLLVSEPPTPYADAACEVVRETDAGITRHSVVIAAPLGRRALINDWLASKIAVGLGLEVAKPEIVQVPDWMLRIASKSDINHVDAGPQFGSRFVARAATMALLALLAAFGAMRKPRSPTGRPPPLRQAAGPRKRQASEAEACGGDQAPKD